MNLGACGLLPFTSVYVTEIQNSPHERVRPKKASDEMSGPATWKRIGATTEEREELRQLHRRVRLSETGIHTTAAFFAGAGESR